MVVGSVLRSLTSKVIALLEDLVSHKFNGVNVVIIFMLQSENRMRFLYLMSGVNTSYFKDSLVVTLTLICALDLTLKMDSSLLVAWTGL